MLSFLFVLYTQFVTIALATTEKTGHLKLNPHGHQAILSVALNHLFSGNVSKHLARSPLHTCLGLLISDQAKQLEIMTQYSFSLVAL